jgi:hypothetical protein
MEYRLYSIRCTLINVFQMYSRENDQFKAIQQTTLRTAPYHIGILLPAYPSTYLPACHLINIHSTEYEEARVARQMVNNFTRHPSCALYNENINNINNLNFTHLPRQSPCTQIISHSHTMQGSTHVVFLTLMFTFWQPWS